MLCSTIFAMAQMMDPVKISSELKMLKGAEAEIIFSATIDAGWHLYSTDLGNDGPTSAALIVNKLDGAELVGKLKPVGKEVENLWLRLSFRLCLLYECFCLLVDIFPV